MRECFYGAGNNQSTAHSSTISPFFSRTQSSQVWLWTGLQLLESFLYTFVWVKIEDIVYCEAFHEKRTRVNEAFERFFDPKLPEKNLGFSCLTEDLNFKETETESDSGESKVASTLETRLFNLKWKIKTGNMAEFTFVVRGCSLLTFILVEANYVSLIMWLFLHCPQNTPLWSSLISKCSFTPTKWPPCLFWVHFKQRMQNIMTVCFGLLFQLI